MVLLSLKQLEKKRINYTITIIIAYLNHKASTVRQSASSVLSKVLHQNQDISFISQLIYILYNDKTYHNYKKITHSLVSNYLMYAAMMYDLIATLSSY